MESAFYLRYVNIVIQTVRRRDLPLSPRPFSPLGRGPMFHGQISIFTPSSSRPFIGSSIPPSKQRRLALFIAHEPATSYTGTASEKRRKTRPRRHDTRRLRYPKGR